MCRLLILLFLVYLHLSLLIAAGLYVSENTTIWNSYPCQLAKPEIEVAEDGKLIVNDPRVKPGEDMWIGVYLAPRCFTYVGCDISEEAMESFTVKTFGDCSTACGCMAFGIRKNNKNFDCICVNDLNRPPHPNCDICSLSGYMFACGAENGPYFSIYTSESETDSVCDECTTQGNCLIFQYNDTNQQRVFEWRSCDRDESYRVLCSNMPFSKSPVHAVYPGMDTFTSTWIQASNTCFMDKKYPSSYKSIIETKFNALANQPHWTGIIKMPAMRTLDKYGPSCTNEFGYLKKKHGIYEVKFEGEIKSKLSLCEEETATDVSQEKCHASSSNSSSSEESSAAILAGILVPMTLLIAVIIIIIVAIKKRDILRSWFTSCISERNERQCRSKPSQEISNPVLNSTTNTEQDLKTSVNNPSHVVREKPIQGASGFVKTKTDTEPYALPGDMYAEYDTLKESNNSNQSEDHDHANTARFVNGSPLKVNFADADLVYNEVSVTDGNDYDHIATQNIDSDNDNGIERQTADGTDDAYNNLNIDRKSSSETDNPNNIPNNLNNDNGNAYRDDNPYNFPDNVNSDD
ncbi:uncharacterized protein LOC128234728 isoform X3 [Mya arenaria]|uniref:uncharacterized protein LOC128234728 isoform X3 n=1 Tax=Mya arenaria TaxID=6604 RepID=UPI0022E8DF91|nr:uncharacterized protein LOC128234728 isoform X3 [Mya arenaria]